MALIKCPECGQEISDQSKRCVHCGFTLKKEPKKIPKAVAIIGLILLILDVAAFALFEFGPEDITDCWYYDADVHIALFAVLYVSLILVLIYCISNKKIKLFLISLAVLIPIMAGLAVGGKIKCENELYEEYESHANAEDRFLIYEIPLYDYAKASVKYGKYIEFLGEHKVSITSFTYTNSDGLTGTSQVHYYTYSFKTNLFGIYGQYIDDGTTVFLIDEDGNSFKESDSGFSHATWSTEKLSQRY